MNLFVVLLQESYEVRFFRNRTRCRVDIFKVSRITLELFPQKFASRLNPLSIANHRKASYSVTQQRDQGVLLCCVEIMWSGSLTRCKKQSLYSQSRFRPYFTTQCEQ